MEMTARRPPVLSATSSELDRRDAAHSSSDFEPARIRRGSAICAEADGPALWSRLRRRSRLRSHLTGKLTGAWQAHLMPSTPIVSPEGDFAVWELPCRSTRGFGWAGRPDGAAEAL